MGYYVRTDEVDWEISETPEALATVREMPTKYHALKRGGSSTEKWFSWMNDTSIETAETVESVFNQLGFETESIDGGFRIISYDNKTGQEDLFLAVMAPFTKHGSIMEWRGEDDANWRYHIYNGKMYVDEATVTWTHSTPYTYMHMTFDSETSVSQTYSFDINDSERLAEVANISEQQKAKNDAYYETLRKARELAESLTK